MAEQYETQFVQASSQRRQATHGVLVFGPEVPPNLLDCDFCVL